MSIVYVIHCSDGSRVTVTSGAILYGDCQLLLGATKARRVDSIKPIGWLCDVSVATVAGAVEYQQSAVERMFGVSLFTIRTARAHGSLCRRSDDGDRFVNTGYARSGDNSCCGDGQVFCDLPSGEGGVHRKSRCLCSVFASVGDRCRRQWQARRRQ